jgi:hypothetical protein
MIDIFFLKKSFLRNNIKGKKIKQKKTKMIIIDHLNEDLGSQDLKWMKINGNTRNWESIRWKAE